MVNFRRVNLLWSGGNSGSFSNAGGVGITFFNLSNSYTKFKHKRKINRKKKETVRIGKTKLYRSDSLQNVNERNTIRDRIDLCEFSANHANLPSYNIRECAQNFSFYGL
jgi:hypothetical protein